MICPYCGSENIRELGYEDGGGDYGEAVTLAYCCDNCGEHFEESDLDVLEDDDQDDQPSIARRKPRRRRSRQKPLPIFRG